jgi:hypothetical protein
MYSASIPHVAMDSNGNAMVVWQQVDSKSNTCASLPASLWCDQNSMHTVQYLTPLTGATYKYASSSTTGGTSVRIMTTQNGVTSITVTGTGTIAGVYSKIKL